MLNCPQWVYYSKIKRRSSSFPTPTQPIHTIKYSSFQHPSVRTPLLIQSNATKTLEDELTPYSVSASPSKWYTLTSTHHDDEDNQSNISSSKKAGGTVLFAVMLLGYNLSNVNTTNNIVTNSATSYDTLFLGQIIAWTCTALYLTSRIPQIMKNHNRQSVEGLSPSLFMFAACGNLTYFLSIVLHPSQTWESLLGSASYLIGSAGTLSFDAFIFAQFLWYTRKSSLSSHRSVDSISRTV
ncbi:hypothetical protein EC973_002925 [Apophysomyces ossiformis]|uniref:Uncharacterized protein n=1 Tax=Apophysomyces ossiformis TaxID=679940 RepID=A0A8H7BIG5_9FUNG|nr:hypothetical protein EC973_002925 [Apophysomyces ossiformis]